MTPYQAAVLGLVQGITEFVPVSSSAHLILTSYLLGWSDQGLAFDMAVHAGSLLALVAYLRSDLFRIGAAMTARGGGDPAYRRLGWQLLIATLPVALAGLLLEDFVGSHLRDPAIVASSLVVFGLFLWSADRWGGKSSSIDSLSWGAAVALGVAQALALLPGTSRSGVTMTAALIIGLGRTEAARFSFLLAVPALTLVAAKTVLDLATGEGGPVEVLALAVGFAAAAVSAYLAVAWMLRWLQTRSMSLFAWYRVILGLGILSLRYV